MLKLQKVVHRIDDLEIPMKHGTKSHFVVHRIDDLEN